MKNKVTIFFSQRTRYFIIVGMTLLPIVSVMLAVFLIAYKPVFSSLEDIAQKGTTGMYPLRNLHLALLYASMPPNDYLIHGNASEQKTWKQLKKIIDERFKEILQSSSLTDYRDLFIQFKADWEYAAKEGDDLLHTHIDPHIPKSIADKMEAFDDHVYRTATNIGKISKIISDDILSQHSQIRKLKTHGIAFTCSAVLLGLLAGIAGSIILSRSREKMLDLTLKDPLTGAYNRRGLNKELLKMKKHQVFYTPPCFSILLMDLDRFKQINDQYGHDAGDAVLKQFSDTLRYSIREQDVFGRFGGEEFLILLPSTPTKQAKSLAERIRQKVEITDIDLPNNGGQISVTVSIGCATFSEDSSDIESVLKAADKAMYLAKDSGRNRVVCEE